MLRVPMSQAIFTHLRMYNDSISYGRKIFVEKSGFIWSRTSSSSLWIHHQQLHKNIWNKKQNLQRRLSCPPFLQPRELPKKRRHLSEASTRKEEKAPSRDSRQTCKVSAVLLAKVMTCLNNMFVDIVMHTTHINLSNFPHRQKKLFSAAMDDRLNTELFYIYLYAYYISALHM